MPSIDKLLEGFVYHSRDFVFLVDYGKRAQHFLGAARASMLTVFERFLDQGDRVSLITFARNTRRLFPLTSRDKNTT